MSLPPHNFTRLPSCYYGLQAIKEYEGRGGGVQLDNVRTKFHENTSTDSETKRTETQKHTRTYTSDRQYV
jgi:hypothetical protein